MEISFSSYSINDDHITTKCGTCHDSPAVVPCAQFCSDNFISNPMRAKWNFHHIWIVMEKLLVKWSPGPHFDLYSMSVYYILIIIHTLQKNSTSIFAKILILQNKSISLCPTKYWMSCKIDAHSFLLMVCANINHGVICEKGVHLYNAWILLLIWGGTVLQKICTILFHMKPGDYCTDYVVQKGANPLFVYYNICMI